jgi:hypothetical protein
MKSFGGPVREADHLRQIIVDDGLVRDEHGSGKAGGEVRLQLVMVSAEQNGAAAFDVAGNQHLAQGAFAGRKARMSTATLSCVAPDVRRKTVSEIMRSIGLAP